MEQKCAVRKSAIAPPTASLASARDTSADKSPDPSLASPLLRCEWFTPGSTTTGWFFAAYLDIQTEGSCIASVRQGHFGISGLWNLKRVPYKMRVVKAKETPFIGRR